MKTVLFIPGFRQDMKTHDYSRTISAIESKGYHVVFVPINWRYTVITDWVRQVNLVYAKYDAAQTIVAGFSYGAVTALVVAAQRNPSELWLFSLSPYFAEDMPNMKEVWLRRIGKRRVEAFKQLSFAKLAKLVTCKTIMVVGDHEANPFMYNRVKTAQRVMPHVDSTISPNTWHDITSDAYIKTIKKIIT